MIVKIGCAIRGRADQNKKWKQQLEINSMKYANCITSVSKDSMILEVEIDDISGQCSNDNA